MKTVLSMGITRECNPDDSDEEKIAQAKVELYKIVDESKYELKEHFDQWGHTSKTSYFTMFYLRER